MKKLVSLVLALCMMLSLFSFANAEEGKVIKVWNDYTTNLGKPFDVWGMKINNFAVMYAALEEYAHNNGATWMDAGAKYTNLQTSITANDIPDFYDPSTASRRLPPTALCSP